jgi:deoxyribodipyrimidine photo-lyase
MSNCLVWFHNDLRLSDNLALNLACQSGKGVIPIFIWSSDEANDWHLGGAAKWWLHHSLESLSLDLKKIGSGLIIKKGQTKTNISKLIEDHNVSEIFMNRRFEPKIIERDNQIFSDNDVKITIVNGNLLFNPEDIKTGQGRNYTVFTPFWKNCKLQKEPHRPIKKPDSLKGPDSWPSTVSLEDIALLPKIKWYTNIEKTWKPGEKNAKRALTDFLVNNGNEYGKNRNIPGIRGTSRLSPHLRFGEISPHTIWHEAKKYSNKGVEHFVREVGWREFSYHLLNNFPFLTNKPLRPEFENFPWASNSKYLDLWKKGLTGYPIVDAGMRELWSTGWMHNRVRMIVASFLVKHLLLDWKEGANWFWDTLVDADLASNTSGWQWTAGCGADAAPYFRVFNPILQGKRFDSTGDYVRKWIPEIKKIPNGKIHTPWEVSKEELQNYEIVLGHSYPKPIVDHAEARKVALEAFDRLMELKKNNA